MARQASRIEAAAHSVRHVPIERPDGFWTEAQSAFALNGIIARTVKAAAAENRFPLVLSGNCNSAVGALMGLGDAARTAVAWFDAHGDLNTPDTTRSGYLDGMALSIAFGDAYPLLASSIEGFSAFPADHVLLLGARDVEPGEIERIGRLGVRWLPPSRMSELGTEVASMSAAVSRALIHVDLDVLDPSEGEVNSYSAPGGLSADELIAAVRTLGVSLPIAGAVIASWDPSLDAGGRILATTLRLIDAILSTAARS